MALRGVPDDVDVPDKVQRNCPDCDGDIASTHGQQARLYCVDCGKTIALLGRTRGDG